MASTGSSMPLQCLKALPQQIDRQMVEQSGEPLSLPVPCTLRKPSDRPTSRCVESVCDGEVFSVIRFLSSPASAAGI